ncbi:hypothetical protein MMC25_002978 [Agyrium rufum]|nr:hypothetical protein [Agyrium rufum]
MKLMTESERKKWLQLAIIFIYESSKIIGDPKFPGKWDRWQKLVPHVQTLQGHAEMCGIASTELLETYLLVGLYLDACGQNGEATLVFEQAHAEGERLLGPEHPLTLMITGSLASAYGTQGRLAEAENLGLHILETSRKSKGTEHVHTLMGMGVLAKIYQEQKRFAEAESFFLQITAISNELLGPEDGTTLNSMTTLAQIYVNEDRAAEAEGLCLRVLEVRHRSPKYGDKHIDTLACMAILVAAYTSQGSSGSRLPEAERLGSRVLEIRQRVQGPGHPDTLNCMHVLVQVYRANGHEERAMGLMGKVVALMIDIFGPDDPRTVRSAAALTSWGLAAA